MAQYRKALVAVAGGALTLLGVAADALGTMPLPEPWRPWAAVVVALATAAGVYQTPNAPAQGRHEKPGA